MKPTLLLALALVAWAPAAVLGQSPPAGPVVLNEIFYHPPSDRPLVQWVELFNSGTAEADVGGWSFTKGLTFKFPDGTKLPAGGFVVVVEDAAAFRKQYGTNIPVAGTFTGHLSGKGERIELRDAQNKLADWMHYSDKAPWPIAADAGACSLERINPAARSDIPGNWAASRPGRGFGPGGTPGRRNDAYQANLPPIASELQFESQSGGKANHVSVRWNDPDGIAAATLAYRVGTARGWGEEKILAMKQSDGDKTGGTYAVDIPAAAEGSVVRFHLRAADSTGAERIWPSPQELSPDFSYLSWARPERGTIGQLHLWVHGKAEAPGPSFRNQRLPVKGRPAPGQVTAIYVPAEGDPILLDFIRLSNRAGGWKVRAGHGRTLLGMKTANVIFESEARWVLAEHLAYVVYRSAGVPAPDSGHMRVIMDGQSLGYHLYVEQPDDSFLARHQRDPEGNMYKILWYGRGLVAQHEKKNHPLSGHDDLKKLIDGLASRDGEAQWKYIQETFNVDEVVNYFVVNTCIQNWDGYFNNYFTFHGPGPKGRWEMYPWDEDKTWGDYDGASARHDWYSMPLTYGMNGDAPASGGPSGLFGGPMWWRPAGWFSGPLLSNPGFRKRYLERLREFCNTEFTEPKLRPVIDALEKQMEPEIRHRAEVREGREDSVLRQFHGDCDSFRRQVVNRRDFILKHL